MDPRLEEPPGSRLPSTRGRNANVQWIHSSPTIRPRGHVGLLRARGLKWGGGFSIVEVDLLGNPAVLRTWSHTFIHHLAVEGLFGVENHEEWEKE